jgi:hypothetical protein
MGKNPPELLFLLPPARVRMVKKWEEIAAAAVLVF